jgi:hypothetical protein
MDPLKISSVELDDREPFRATFNVHLSGDMTDFERQTLPPLLSGSFLPSEARGAAVVAIRNATIAMIEHHRELLKQIVAEAESLAKTMERSTCSCRPSRGQSGGRPAARRSYRLELKSAAAGRQTETHARSTR